MKRSSMLLAAIGLAVGVAAFMTMTRVEAQSPEPVAKPTGKYAVCDVRTLLSQHDRRAVDKEELRGKRDAFKQADQKRVEAIKQAQKVLDKLKLDSKEYKTSVEKLAELYVVLDVRRRTAEASITRLERELLAATFSDVLAAVAAVAKKEGYDMVLQKVRFEPAKQSVPDLLNSMAMQQCLYAGDAIDITEAVLKQVNKQYKASKKRVSKGR